MHHRNAAEASAHGEQAWKDFEAVAQTVLSADEPHASFIDQDARYL